MDVKQAIVKYCRYQERCHAEVRNKLYELGCTTPEVEEHLANVIEAGLVSEERFARAYARGHFRMKQWGREKIKQGLKLKKISDYCIRKGLSEIDAAEYDAITEKLVDKKLKELKGERSKNILKGKIFRYMMQKGYESDIILDMINNKIK